MAQDQKPDKRKKLGRVIEALRKEHWLAREMLGGRELSGRYIAALERGKVAPSSAPLALLATRLGIGVEELSACAFPAPDALNIEAQKEDFAYAIGLVDLALISNPTEGLSALDTLERDIAPYRDRLSPRELYLLPYHRGRAHAKLAKLDSAVALLQQALDAARGEPDLEAKVNSLLGAVYYGRQEYKQAIKHLHAALEYAQSHLNRELRLAHNVYQNLAHSYMGAGYLHQAINAYRRALDIAANLNEELARARLYWGLAETYIKLDKLPHAMTCGLQARDIYNALGNKGEAVAVMVNLAEAQLENHGTSTATGLLENHGIVTAAALLEQAHAALEEYDHPGLRLYYHAYTARRHRYLGELERACEQAALALLEAEILCEKVEAGEAGAYWPWIGHRRALGDALLEAARSEAAAEHMDKAKTLFERGIEVARAMGDEDLERTIARAYADMLAAMGDHRSAAEVLGAALSPA